ncbi:uncharacterized protein LOC120841262 [Ixodes scapularis]|uniref:uncharacterized protein LOC120841262 n=1 Tax=Ixodes scapularis TaxID=6945 RepID=UPI001A9DC6F4|nr:uncharacterized protein LOC120841262 [Ixodes scapularis]
MKPSAEKTKLLIFGRERDNINPTLKFDELTIEKSDEHTILGIHVNTKLNPDKWIKRMRDTWRHGTSIIRRIANKHGGDGEGIARTIVQAALIPKVMYGGRFYRLTLNHWARLETLMNDARRCISGLPRQTRLEELHKCVPFPSLKELASTQEQAQRVKMQHTKQGREIAKLLGWKLENNTPIPDQLPPWERIDIAQSAPIPRKMNSDKNKERRRHKAMKHAEEVKAIIHCNDSHTIVCYPDASFSERGNAALAWYVENTKTTCTKHAPYCRTAQEAEITAIEEALNALGQEAQCGTSIIMFTDSQDAIRSLKTHQETGKAIRNITTTAIKLRMRDIRASVRWIPGHEGIEGNEIANEAAGELTRSFLRCLQCHSEASAPSRTHQNPPQMSQPIESSKCEPDGFYDPFWEIKAARIALKKNIDKHKDVARESLPKGFRRHESVLLRRLQAGAAITPSITKKWADAKKKKKNPDFVPKPDQCKYCLENLRADTQHLVWECSKLDQERNDALGALNHEDKPSTLDEWVNPAGDSERRSLILRSLVDFLKTADLGRDL